MQNLRPTGSSTSFNIPQRSSRGVQLEEVLAAADALVDAGLKPTIERVRQQLGRGSPNTVSPMLDVWFSTLSQRLKGGPTVADEEARKLPAEMVQAAQRLWEAATRSAQLAQAQQNETTQRELDLHRAALEAQELNLNQREAAFAQSRKALEAALTSSQQEKETMSRQLNEQASQAQVQAAEFSRIRVASDKEIARLNGVVAELQAGRETLRAQHAQTLNESQRVAQEAEARHIERHTATERRLLAEVDRAREEAKRATAAAAKERDARAQAEQSAALVFKHLSEEVANVRAGAEEEKQAALARAQQVQALHQREMEAHDATRTLLKQALSADKPLKATVTGKPSRKQPKTSN